jgi:hypothetical protein
MMPKRKVPYIAVLFVVSLLLAGYFFNTKKFPFRTTYPSTTSALREYVSDDMNFVVGIPRDSEVEELSNTLSIKSTAGTIWITREGTNYETFDEFWQGIKRANSTFEEKRSVEGEWEIVSYKTGNEKAYIFFSKGKYFTLSTESSNLFDTLDQIAKSFRYTP